MGLIGESDQVAVSKLQSQLEHSDEAVRATTLVALTQVVDETEQLVPILVAGLRDKQWAVRRKAADQLGGLGGQAEAAVPELLVLLRSDDDDDQDLASDALRQIDTASAETVPMLIEILKDQGSGRRVRYYALHLLKKTGPSAKSALPVLEELLEKLEGRSREYLRRAIRDIREIPDPESA